jgi:hypothetical protein
VVCVQIAALSESKQQLEKQLAEARQALNAQ